MVGVAVAYDDDDHHDGAGSENSLNLVLASVKSGGAKYSYKSY